MSGQDAISREQAFRAPEPLADHVFASLRFLRRVASVELIGGDKKSFEFLVRLNVDSEDAESSTPAFTIRVDDVYKLQKLVADACRQHVDLSAYYIPTCALCEPFKTPKTLPVDTKDRLLHSKDHNHKNIEARFASFVEGAVVPPTNPQLYCEGVTRFPPAVTKFLLLGVDQTKL